MHIKNNMYLSYEELNILDVAVRNRMKNQSVKNIPSYQEKCKKILDKVREEMRRQEQQAKGLTL